MESAQCGAGEDQTPRRKWVPGRVTITATSGGDGGEKGLKGRRS